MNQEIWHCHIIATWGKVRRRSARWFLYFTALYHSNFNEFLRRLHFEGQRVDLHICFMIEAALCWLGGVKCAAYRIMQEVIKQLNLP